MKLSFLIPTFNNAATVERTLRSALAQRYRPLEILVYDEASRDGTLDVIRQALTAGPSDIDVELRCSDTNSGPVRAWRVPLWTARGQWCCFLWSDDVLEPTFSEAMMTGAARAADAGRKLVFCNASIEVEGRLSEPYAADAGLVDPLEFSFGIFARRYSVNQVNGVYATEAARVIFDRHVDIPNPYAFDYARYPYGNDVGFLSELAEVGGGVELFGERLVRLVESTGSMTRAAKGAHLWRFRWQYTYNFFRVWSTWRDKGIPGAASLVKIAERRLALCALMMRRQAPTPRALGRSLAAARDILAWDHWHRPLPFAEYRRRVAHLRSA